MQTVTFENNKQVLEYAASNADQILVLFSTYVEIEMIDAKLPENVIVASSFAQTYAGARKERGFTGFVIDKNECEIVPIADLPILSRYDLKKAYDKVKDNPNAFMYLIADGLSGQEDMILTSLYFMRPDFKMIGGSAGDTKHDETLIYYGSHRVKHLCIFVDCKKRTKLVKENIYVPTGKKMLVTNADPIKRCVYTFNNRPADEEYARILGIPLYDLHDAFMSHPLGQKVDGELFINSPQKINHDHSITFYSEIIPNEFIDVLGLGDMKQIMAETREKMGMKPSTLLSINCVLRDLYFKKHGKWREVFASLDELNGKEAGYVSAGEQYNFEHCNQTMVLLGIE